MKQKLDPNKTFIQISKDTRSALKELKIVKKESYDELIQRLIKPLLQNESGINSCSGSYTTPEMDKARAKPHFITSDDVEARESIKRGDTK